MFFGGYPGAATLIKDENRWARYMGTSIVEPTISQDILMMEEVRKPALLRSLFLLGAGYSSNCGLEDFLFGEKPLFPE